MLLKESHGYAVLPGLRDPGRVLRAVNPPPDRQGRAGAGRARRDAWRTYWHGWKRFLEEQAIAPGWVSPDDVALFRVANSVEEAANEILGFYATTVVPLGGDLLVLRVLTTPSKPSWRTSTAGSPTSSPPARSDPSHPATGALQQRRLGPGPVALRFDRYHFGRLRMLIDALTSARAEEPGPPSLLP